MEKLGRLAIFLHAKGLLKYRIALIMLMAHYMTFCGWNEEDSYITASQTLMGTTIL